MRNIASIVIAGTVPRIKAPLLFCGVLLGLGAVMNAGQVFDIPRIDGVTVDGKISDWGEKGFCVETLASESGEVREPRDFDAAFRLGWDERGLLVLVTVHERKITEADDPRELYRKDGVEMFLGTAPGSPEYFQLLAGTGADPKFPSLRTVVNDLRKPASPTKPDAEAGATRTPDGYVLEARLPWSNLAITPKPGVEAAFQICVNDVDELGSKLGVTWHPINRTAVDSKAMFRVRLAAKAGLPVRTATRVKLDGGQPRADIIGPIDLAGKQAVATANGAVFSTSKFEPDAGRARATLFLPPATAEISCKGSAGAVIDSKSVDALVSKAIADVHLAFRPSVFSGEKFPQCDFEASDATNALGKCVMTPTFYDADYHEVKTAVGPGRYGAIVQVKTRAGQTFKRFATLFRARGEINWRAAKILASPVEFPPELGLDPAAVTDRAKDVDAFFKRQIREGINRSDEAAIFFAGIGDLKPGEPRTNRDSPGASAQKWLYGLKKQTGNLRTDYYVHLPATYESDLNKKWPLILFLHGSGERGYDINEVRNTGLPHNLDTQPAFPCIVIAPQCSPDEWWSVPELKDLLDRVEAKYRTDPSRVYLTGLSMGGYGSWALAADSPSRFAAVVPICGGGDPENAARIKDIPIWVFHGGKDHTVPIQQSQAMVDALKKLGGNVKFTIFPEAGHDSWTQAYAMPELYDWLFQQHL